MEDAVENLGGRIIDGAISAGWGDRVAIREGARELTYSALADKVKRGAAALRSLGIGPQDRVAVFMPDCLESATAILAAVYAGAVALPLSELSAVNDLRQRLNNATASIVIVHASLSDAVAKIRGDVPSLKTVVTMGVGAGGSEPDFLQVLKNSEPAEAAPVRQGDVALLLYSGGASKLRGVPHCHRTPLLAFESFGRGFLRLSEEDRVFSTVRLSTAYGLGTGLIFPLLSGAQSLLLPEQPSSVAIFDRLRTFRPTVFAGTPSLFGQLARDAELTPQGASFADTRLCLAGAEDMPPKVVALVKSVLGADVSVGYGLTEAFQFVMAGSTSCARPGSSGFALDGFDLRIVDDEGKTVDVDEIGTLEVRGPSVINRYWAQSESTLSEDGWFRTLDRFLCDKEKRYYHCGRSDQRFKVGGKWVSPSEVERVLLSHEAVWECAVIGAADEDGLVKPFAFVVPNLGHTPSAVLEETLRNYVKQGLPPYNYPRWFAFVDELPKGPNGVVLRYKLRDRLKTTGPRRRPETRTGQGSFGPKKSDGS